jgi:hypothetical protein
MKPEIPPTLSPGSVESPLKSGFLDTCTGGTRWDVID